MIELTVSIGNKAGTFTTALPDGTVLVANRPQTIRPAARRLLDLGYDPETLLTCRTAGAASRSFAPRSIWRWAMEQLGEGDRFAVARWAPHPRAETPNWYGPLVARLDAEHDDAERSAA